MTTRREFIAFAAAAPVLGAGLSQIQAPLGPDLGSALKSGKSRQLKYESLPGFLSPGQIKLHHSSHYGGAIKSLEQISAALQTADRSQANSNWSAVRDLKREELHAINSILLHELYFEGLTAKTLEPSAALKALFEKHFGSFDKWLEDFKAAATASRGWAVLALQPFNEKLYNLVADAHDLGGMWLGIPIIVFDCYEHAYYVDHQSRKGDYISAFPKYIDWTEIERRAKSLLV